MNDRERKGTKVVNKKTFRIVAVFLCIIMLLGLTPLAYAGEKASGLPENGNGGGRSF